MRSGLADQRWDRASRSLSPSRQSAAYDVNARVECMLSWQRVAAMDYEAQFVRDSRICGGETLFRGTRVLLRTVLADLADGNSIPDILKDFPSLTEEHVRAAIAFAAAAARDDMPVPAVAGSR